MTNPHIFLAVIGAISLLIVATRIGIYVLSHIVDARRARRARDRLVGRSYWSPNLVATPVEPVLASWLSTQRSPRSRVATFAIALIIGTASGLAYCAVADASPCGEERATVKLGLDEEAKRIDTSPSETTITALVNLPRPSRIPESRRASVVERTMWRIDAQVTAYKLEADGDYHVVVDSDGRHMIVELPNPDCAAPGAWGEQVRSARAAFERLLSDRGMPMPGKKLHRTSIPVRVNGVGFFDKLHGQTGVAGNGIELHPVLSIEVGGGA